MLLGLKTDNPVAELYLYGSDGQLTAEKTWQADRELAHGLLRYIDEFLAENTHTIRDVTGLFVFEGPGSFTGLRIGLTVMNTLAYGLGVPIVGVSGYDWRAEAVNALTAGQNDRVVMPLYGAEARITAPKK